MIANIVLQVLGHALPLNPVSDRVYRALVAKAGLVPEPSVVRLSGDRRFAVFQEKPRALLNNPDFYIYYFGEWEPRLTRVLRRLVRTGDICVDVGANVGWYTLLLSRLTGLSGEVHAFEPDPRAFARLAANVAMSGRAANVHLNDVALGAAPGRMALHGQVETLYSSLHGGATPGLPSFDVEVEALDRYVERRGLARAELAKLDCEGGEMAALRGAERFLRRLEVPPIIQIEVNPQTARSAGFDVADMLSWLGELRGYRFYRPTVLGGLQPIRSAAAAAADPADLFCAVPGLHADRLRAFGIR